MKLTHKIADDIQDILFKLRSQGFEVYYVGGLVRNFLLNIKGNDDIDVSTSASPAELIEFAKKNSVNYLTIGEAHGTITFIVNKQTVEITSFRKDIQTNGRHAVVEFCKDVRLDAIRRDFTINALYSTLDGDIFSPIETALDDAHKKEVIFINDPEERIKEDVLRILRYYRFSALIKIPHNIIDVSHKIQNLLPSIRVTSKERNRVELQKLLTGNYVFEALEYMEKFNIFSFFFGVKNLDIEKLKLFQERFQDVSYSQKLYILTKGNVLEHCEKFNLTRIEKKEISTIDILINKLINLLDNIPELINYRYDYDDDFLKKILWIADGGRNYDKVFEKNLPEFTLTYPELKKENIADKELKIEYRNRRLEFIKKII